MSFERSKCLIIYLDTLEDAVAVAHRKEDNRRVLGHHLVLTEVHYWAPEVHFALNSAGSLAEVHWTRKRLKLGVQKEDSPENKKH